MEPQIEKTTGGQKFILDIAGFKKKMLLRLGLLLSLNLVILSWGYFRLPADERTRYTYIFAGFLIIIFFLLYHKFKRQIHFQENTYVIIEGNILKQFTINDFCTEVDLTTLQAIEKDMFRSYHRISLVLEDFKLSIINPLEPEKILQELERISGKKAKILVIEKNQIFSKAVIFFSPFFLTLALFWAGKQGWITMKIPIPLLLSIFNVNFIFFLNQFKESRFAGGIDNRTANRLIFVLTVVLAYQLYKIFY